MGLVGALVHASFDVVLIAVCLAGIRRATGLTLQTSYLSSKSHQRILGTVVGVGERLFDVAVAFMCAYPSVFRREQVPRPRSESPD
ncbi:hypothetical protein IW146_002847 [Coemansia sp. RSA 922]|nr:hypothetical protein GGI14_002180 [Coemansia sp. S680]KAJ2034166.1 hypothetical protein GGI08_008987 [Coemansia sp. S2]KAJ2036763.1 hypothetical protein H4S03_003430 [Coemansia sp. S3946]KAJ2056147.1 hypothetical protein GGH13_007641 [Coemansia sp. S155-1]KAJ2090608.1 hypothetical protein GGI16_006106 [Coemansia sp. S142-1]KAJ2114739.1 hypothetical protein IW146_002847 [Coemansia sp. RSA 922]KAJ2337184.1 hypothetical protein GGH92_007580 [Coemansia sp. RSA 2673]